MAIKHEVRTDWGGTKKVSIARGTAIHYFCSECMGFQIAEVKNCTDKLCPLFPFRGAKKNTPRPRTASQGNTGRFKKQN